MKRDLAFEATYPHPPEKVWRALTDSRAIAKWLMENDFQPRVGHRFRFRTKPMPGWDGIVDGEVLEADPPRRLVYTWVTSAIDTRVAITLQPVEGGTKLRLVHSGFEGVRPVLLSFLMGSGWKGIIRKGIPEVVERIDEIAPAAAASPA